MYTYTPTKKMKQESIFAEYFGDSPLVRIMNFLILGKDFDYSMTEIANGAGVGWTSFTRAWKSLLKKSLFSKVLIPALSSKILIFQKASL